MAGDARAFSTVTLSQLGRVMPPKTMAMKRVKRAVNAAVAKGAAKLTKEDTKSAAPTGHHPLF